LYSAEALLGQAVEQFAAGVGGAPEGAQLSLVVEEVGQFAEERGEELGLCVEDDSCPELFSPDLDPEKI